MLNKITAKFHDGITAVSHQANISVDSRGFVISRDELKQIRWDLDKIIIIDPPTKDRPTILTYEDNEEARLIIEDYEAGKKLFDKIPKKRRSQTKIRTFVAYIAVMLGLVLCIFIIIPQMSPLIVKSIPRKWDVKFGHFVTDYFTENFKTCSNQKGQVAVDRLVKKITSGINSSYDYKTIVIKNSQINAFSASGGFTIILSGLIEKAESPDELAGVLAHEIGHSESRHGTEFIIRNLSTTFMLDVVTGGGGSALYIASQLKDLSFSRDKEREADSFGQKIIERHNINPMGIVHFFDRLDKIEKKSGLGDIIDIVSTHPNSKERSEMFTKSFNKDKKYSEVMSKEDWEAIKDMCK